MGRRGNMRSRPGFLFIIVFAVCLVIVYFSWRSMVAPDLKVKDNYSVQVQSFLNDNNKLRNTGGGNLADRQKTHRDPYYNINNQRQKIQLNAPPLNQYDIFKKNFSNEGIRKSQPVDVKISERLPDARDKKQFYRNPNNLIMDTVNSMQRYVHLDLKGAPPKLKYVIEFIALVKKLGATGLLIEYEDMFPYSGKLQSISAKNAYSKEDIKEILNAARVINLKVMPLIQAFGHMEFVLRSDFSNLRESQYTPQVIDITQNASYDIITEMVTQILNAHPDATHLHIGCDEVYELGKGATSVEMQRQKITETQLFLRHVHRVGSIVRRHGGRGVVPVMWDDELRKTPLSEIMSSKLPSVVEIMVWHYTNYVSDVITREVLDKYSQAFKSVWIASAFKGATGSRQFYTDPSYHIENHYGWLDMIAANSGLLTFKGVALTGWQRYDHFATLCELLPVAIPSLAVCLATMMNAGFTEKIHTDTSRLLGCSRPIEMSFPEIDKKTGRSVVTQDCRFPGYELYYAMQELYGYTVVTVSNKHRLEGWLSDYQVAHNFSSPGQLLVLSKALTKQMSGYTSVSAPLRRTLVTIYSDDTVEEWIDENIKEPQRRIEEQQKKISVLLLSKSWPQRPLASVGDVKTVNKNSETKIDNEYFQNSDSKINANNPSFTPKQLQKNLNPDNNEYNMNPPYKKQPPPIHSQYQQNEDTKKANLRQQGQPLNSKLARGNNQVAERPDTVFGAQNLPEWNNQKNGKSELTFGDKKSGSSFDFRKKDSNVDGQNRNVDLNKDLNKQNAKVDGLQREIKNDPNQFNFKRDENRQQNEEGIKQGDSKGKDKQGAGQYASKTDKKQNVDVQSERYKLDEKIAQDPPEVKDMHVDPLLDGDDRMRREKYLNGDKRRGQGNIVLPPEVGRSDNSFKSRESLKNKADGVELPDVRKKSWQLI